VSNDASATLRDGEPILPRYDGGCVSNVIPALLDPSDDAPSWLPRPAVEAEQVVFLLVDGLGWEQLDSRRKLAPTLASMAGGPITTIAPTTTATALTSITTGLAPGEHGVMGYRMVVDGRVLNTLRWAVDGKDARQSIVPQKTQIHTPFLGQRPPVITRAEFRTSGFTGAHLDSARFYGFRVVSTIVTETEMLLRRNEPFVYAYYDGLDKVSHEYGLGAHYDAELVAIDRLVADLLGLLRPGGCVVVISDHGQVHVGDRVEKLHPDVASLVSLQSGEGRFRWLHARSGRLHDLASACETHHGHLAWVRTREQTIDEGWWGPSATDDARRRLGDVALVAREPVAFHDPADSGPYELVGRHGSLTSAEVLVPLLAAGV